MSVSEGSNRGDNNSVGGAVESSRLDNFFYSINMIISLVGTVANLLAGIVFLGHRPLRQRIPNYFLVNQCLIDFIIGLNLLLLLTITPSPDDFLSKKLVCFLWKSRIFFTGLFVASMFNLAMLTIERYLEVVHPILHKLSLTRNKVIVALLISWFVGIGFKLSLILPTSKFANGVCSYGNYPSVAASKIGVLFNTLFEFLAPVFVIAVCYSMMMRAIRQTVTPSSINHSSSSSSSSSGTVVSAKIRRNIIKTVLIVVLFMTCTLLPKQGLSFGAGFGFAVDYNGVLFRTSVLFMYLNCCANPFIYLAKYAEFRKGLRKICFRLCHKFLGGGKRANFTEESTKTVD